MSGTPGAEVAIEGEFRFRQEVPAGAIVVLASVVVAIVVVFTVVTLAVPVVIIVTHRFHCHRPRHRCRCHRFVVVVAAVVVTTFPTGVTIVTVAGLTVAVVLTCTVINSTYVLY